MKVHKPTAQEIKAAYGKGINDVIAPNLKCLFVGINPGLYTAAIGHHFGRPGNRFWPSLYAGGFTPRLFSPYEERELLPLGYGITNIVNRATVSANELSKEELVAGGQIVTEKIRKFTPRWAAVVGIQAYRAAFNRPDATIGRQQDTIGDTKLWVLPNPSGLNAHYNPGQLGKVFRELRDAVTAS